MASTVTTTSEAWAGSAARLASTALPAPLLRREAADCFHGGHPVPVVGPHGCARAAVRVRPHCVGVAQVPGGQPTSPPAPTRCSCPVPSLGAVSGTPRSASGFRLPQHDGGIDDKGVVASPGSSGCAGEPQAHHRGSRAALPWRGWRGQMPRWPSRRPLLPPSRIRSARLLRASWHRHQAARRLWFAPAAGASALSAGQAAMSAAFIKIVA